MLDFRRRIITFQLGETWYSVTFRTLPFGRVTDVEVSYSEQESGVLYPCEAKISPQNTTAVQALDMFLGELKSDFKLLLRRIWKKLPDKRKSQ